MKLFLKYLKSKKMILGFVAIVFVGMSVSFYLYELPIKAVAYPMTLCALIGICLLFFDFGKLKVNHRIMEQAKNNLVDVMESLPDAKSIEEEDYQRLVEAVWALKQKVNSDFTIKYNDMVDYYTVWAHQIKTPIASMRLKLQTMDSDDSRELLLNLGRIERYVEMVMNFLRLDSDDSDYVFRESNLDEIIRGSVKKFSGDFINKKLSLCYKPVEYRVLTDEKWFSFVVEQILSNAIKYTKEGSISIYMDGNELCIKDTGIGIDEKDLPRVFEKGYTGFNGRMEKKASGIGLFLVKKTCDRLGHNIKVESKLGEGSTFRIDVSKRDLEVE